MSQELSSNLALVTPDTNVNLTTAQGTPDTNPYTYIINENPIYHITLDDPSIYERNIYYVHDNDSELIEKKERDYEIVYKIIAILTAFIFFVFLLYFFEITINKIKQN